MRTNVLRRYRRVLRACVGPAARRPWLLEVELCFYMLPVPLDLLRESRADNADALAARVTTASYWFAATVAVAVVGLTLSRWWRPDRAVAVGVTAVVVAGAFGVTATEFGLIDSIWSGLVSGAGSVALAAVVRRSRPALAFPAVVVALAPLVYAVTVTDWFNPAPGSFGAGRALQLAGVLDIAAIIAIRWLAPVVIGLVLRGVDARRRAAELARVRAAERMQVARELHDLVANHISGITTYAQAASLRNDVPDELRAMLAAIESAGDDALEGMRRMVGALRNVGDDTLGSFDAMPTTATDLRGAVRSAIGEYDGAVRTVTRLAPELAPLPAPPPADVLATVHRLVVEALTNVQRHAPQAQEILVTVDLPRPDVLRVEVGNDGAGRPSRVGARRGGGFGLVGLRERVAALGGTLHHGRAGTDHWVVRAELPWRTDA